MNSPETGRILVIDDNKTIHEDFRKILDSPNAGNQDLDMLETELFGENTSERVQDFEVTSAYQGREGLEMVEKSLKEERPFAVAFVDVRMPPGWDGIETVSHLWETDPNLQVVICTAYSDHSWEDFVKKLGKSDRLLILKKPFDSIEVLQLTHALTRKWELHRQARKKMQDLESLVEERTRELQQTNKRLIQEITEREKAEDELKHLATHDTLTNLPNRMLLWDRFAHTLARARRSGKSVAFLLLDLDNFKEVNDSRGHMVGDKLLIEVAGRLLKTVRECDTVARLGGDEFVVLIEELDVSENTSIIAERIKNSFKEPFHIENHEIHMTTSMGISVYPSDCDNIEGLMKGADLAMYHIKEEGRNGYRFYDSMMSSRTMERIELRNDIRNALGEQQFALWFQPLVNVQSGQISGMEALIRWNHPKLGLIEPMRFIPLAEETGNIISIGEWVLETTCRQNKQWQNAGLPHVPVAVNMSVQQLMKGKIIDSVKRILKDTELEPEYLELELTESSVMHRIDESIRIISELRRLGARIMIDDFGAGYSSLFRLKSLPINGFKIDHFFIKNVVEDKRDAAIVAAIVGLAQSLKIEVVAEGVETVGQLNFLKSLKSIPVRELRCNRAQGFLFSRPLPGEDATEFLLKEKEKL